jgi:hypothetical protein
MKMKIKGTEETFWIVVSNARVGGHSIPETLSHTKKEAIRRFIEHSFRHDKSCKFMNQPCNKTWKELRENKGWSVQKVKIKIKFYQ